VFFFFFSQSHETIYLLPEIYIRGRIAYKAAQRNILVLRL